MPVYGRIASLRSAATVTACWRSLMTMMVRYFGAARAAAGLDQENLDMADGASLNDVLDALVQLHPGTGDGQPSLDSVVGRSSFLRNEVALKDRAAPLAASDVIDVLPPFAGG